MLVPLALVDPEILVVLVVVVVVVVVVNVSEGFLEGP
jgi:hypothetical protein